MEIQGKLTIDGRTTEFILPVGDYSIKYSQWGADTLVLGSRVDLLEAMADAVAEWAQDNLCSECHDATLDDGEGWDGKCGNCADRDACTECSEVLHDADREVGLCPGCQEDEEEPSDESETPRPSMADDGSLSHREWVQQTRRNQRIVEPDEDTVRQAAFMRSRETPEHA